MTSGRTGVYSGKGQGVKGAQRHPRRRSTEPREEVEWDRGANTGPVGGGEGGSSGIMMAPDPGPSDSAPATVGGPPVAVQADPTTAFADADLTSVGTAPGAGPALVMAEPATPVLPPPPPATVPMGAGRGSGRERAEAVGRED